MGIVMTSLNLRIESLDDNEAVEAVNYLARWMQNDDKLSKSIPPEIINPVENNVLAMIKCM
jgi:hypothetical protein